MKKYSVKNKIKFRIRKRTKRSVKNRTRFKRILKINNKKRNARKKEKYDKETSKFYERFSGFKRIKAPTVLSLIRNSHEVIPFLNKLRKAFDSNKKVFVILKDVKEIHHDAIVVLLSVIIRFKSNKIEFNGDFPDNLSAKKKLIDSGFFHYISRRFIQDEDEYTVNHPIITHAYKKVNSLLGEKIIKKTTKVVFEEERRCQGVQRTMVELMLNTNNHATVGKSGERHWWLSVENVHNEKKACFSFIDYGVGIFKSLDQKSEGNKFFGWWEKLVKTHPFDGNNELLKLILNGELHKTVTGQSYRGKGLPGIKLAMDRGQISNLHIISNDVFADVSKGIYRIMPQNFEGTFIYWELNNQNSSCHGIN